MASLTLRPAFLDDQDIWIIEQKAFDVLNKYLQPDGAISAQSAAQAINELTPMNRRASSQGSSEKLEAPESFLLEICELFIEVAKQIPYDHPSQGKYVEFFTELSALPPTRVTATNGDYITFWKELPHLDTSLDDAWFEPSEHDDTLIPFQQYISLNSFAARLLATGLVSWIHLAIWSLRLALENPLPISQDFQESRIFAAAQWTELSCTKLSERLGDEDDKALLRDTAAGPLFGGKPGLTTERWLFWKERFRAVAEETGSENVKSVAINAASMM